MKWHSARKLLKGCGEARVFKGSVGDWSDGNQNNHTPSDPFFVMTPGGRLLQVGFPGCRRAHLRLEVAKKKSTLVRDRGRPARFQVVQEGPDSKVSPQGSRLPRERSFHQGDPRGLSKVKHS